LRDIASNLKHGVDPAPIVADLEKLKIVTVSYRGNGYKEWRILEEASPLIQLELGIAPPKRAQEAASQKTPVEEGEVDYVALERQEIEKWKTSSTSI
jgi:hypothetical protein